MRLRPAHPTRRYVLHSLHGPGGAAAEAGAPEAVRLILPFPPSANAYWRHVGGRVLLSREARAYRERCRFAAALQWKHAVVEGELRVRADVYFPDRRGDLTNREKQLLDALNGCVWVDDSQIYDWRMVRHLDKQNPRVEMTIEPMTEAAA